MISDRVDGPHTLSPDPTSSLIAARIRAGQLRTPQALSEAAVQVLLGGLVRRHVLLDRGGRAGTAALLQEYEGLLGEVVQVEACWWWWRRNREHRHLWSGRWRGAEATAGLHAAEAALWGAWTSQKPPDGCFRSQLRGRARRQNQRHRRVRAGGAARIARAAATAGHLRGAHRSARRRGRAATCEAGRREPVRC